MAETAIEARNALESDSVDGFIVIERVGCGGFSEVYKVSPEGLEDKLFALKFVHDIRHFPLLEEEARMLAKLNRPQIPSPVKIGEQEGGKYLIMDYVPHNLRKFLEANKDK